MRLYWLGMIHAQITCRGRKQVFKHVIAHGGESSREWSLEQQVLALEW